MSTPADMLPTVMAPFCGAGSGAPESRVTLKKWSAVALWTYDVGECDNCAICLNSLVERCIDCVVDDCAEELCVQVWGVCSKCCTRGCTRGFPQMVLNVCSFL
jgi:hypothetical protein